MQNVGGAREKNQNSVDTLLRIQLKTVFHSTNATTSSC